MNPVSKELLKLADKLSNGIFGDLKNGLLGDPSSSPMAAAADRDILSLSAKTRILQSQISTNRIWERL
jgi:hypothetical protein